MLTVRLQRALVSVPSFSGGCGRLASEPVAFGVTMRAVRLLSWLAAGSLVASLLVQPVLAVASTRPLSAEPYAAAGAAAAPASAEDFVRPDLPSAQLAARLLNHRIE